jgi:hypothetical protein
VLLILDMISDFDFPDGTSIWRAAKRIAPRIALLRERMARADLATIYIKHVQGRWRSDLMTVLSEPMRPKSKGVK